MEDKITSIKEAKNTETAGEDSLVVSLSRTYDFEGEKVSKIDLSGLEDVTAKTMIRASKTLAAAGDVQIMPENSLHYALVIAAGCSKYPIEFYERLKPRDAIQIKNTVSNFFYGGASD